MNTQISALDPNSFTFFDNDLEDPQFTTTDSNAKELLENAKKLLSENQVIAIPTETVYGLASNALCSEAIQKIYVVKNRPLDNPLIIHISSLKMLKKYLLPDFIEIPKIYELVIKKFWPGPLTILLPKPESIPLEVTCNQPTVAVRFPSHPIARALISTCGFPLAAPSANASGKPSPTLASHVWTDLNSKIPLIIDGGQCNFGVESTVLDAISSKDPIILRPGGITFEALVQIPGFENLKVYNKDFIDKKLEMTPTTPGMKYRHYSPNAKVVLIDLGDDRIKSRIILKREVQRIMNGDTKKIGILLFTDNIKNIQNDLLKSKIDLNTNTLINDSDLSNNNNIIEYSLGSSIHPEQVAKELFKGLRCLDEYKVDYIVVEGISEMNEGLAVMNRLRKAASLILKE
ncbi:translation factor [Gigaspora margarita]|uniref:Threonylcarbamoyl-AMP synthase n=1 Tax=Gigaspora margarita TaxID=4874 RepID=A0A8H4A836_GIGMA|nr:translation factor [Gigaspora margarita]